MPCFDLFSGFFEADSNIGEYSNNTSKSKNAIAYCDHDERIR